MKKNKIFAITATVALVAVYAVSGGTSGRVVPVANADMSLDSDGCLSGQTATTLNGVPACVTPWGVVPANGYTITPSNTTPPKITVNPYSTTNGSVTGGTNDVAAYTPSYNNIPTQPALPAGCTTINSGTDVNCLGSANGTANGVASTVLTQSQASCQAGTISTHTENGVSYGQCMSTAVGNGSPQLISFCTGQETSGPCKPQRIDATAAATAATALQNLENSRYGGNETCTAHYNYLPVADPTTGLNYFYDTVCTGGTTGTTGTSGSGSGTGTGTAGTSLPTTNGSSFTINGGATGNFTVGQAWTLKLATQYRNQPVFLCAIHPDGSQSCSGALGGTTLPWTDASGNWMLSGTFDASSIGNWKEWVQFPNAYNNVSGYVQFAVSAAGTGTGNSSGISMSIQNGYVQSTSGSGWGDSITTPDNVLGLSLRVNFGNSASGKYAYKVWCPAVGMPNEAANPDWSGSASYGSQSVIIIPATCGYTNPGAYSLEMEIGVPDMNGTLTKKTFPITIGTAENNTAGMSTAGTNTAGTAPGASVTSIMPAPGSFSATVKANNTHYIRTAASTEASLTGAQTVAAGATFTATGAVAGDTVNGNNMWWITNGGYIWSGGTSVQ